MKDPVQENILLKKENKQLKKLLSVAQDWIKREVKNSVVKLAKRKVSFSSTTTRNAFFNENAEDIITSRIADFFGEILLLNIPSVVVDNIISAELNYYHFKTNPVFDGLSVISSYHKSLDHIIEHFFTK